MRKVAILIPNYNGIDKLPKTIESIINNVVYPHYRIIINDSSSDKRIDDYFDFLKKNYPNKITIMKTPMAGTTKAINQLIKSTDNDEDVLLTQNDVIFPRCETAPCFLSLFTVVAGLNDKIGCVAPINGGGISGENYVAGFPWVGTWCMYLKRETINKIGLFDENFNPGDGDDIDYSYRIFLEGLITYTIDYTIIHDWGVSEDHTAESQEIKERNGRYFREKYRIKSTDIIDINYIGLRRRFDKSSFNSQFSYIKRSEDDTFFSIPEDSLLLKAIKEQLERFSENDIYIDIGAGVGDTSLLINKGYCFAFEPSERNFKLLTKNIKLNSCKVIPIKQALADRIFSYEVEEAFDFTLDKIKITKEGLQTTTIDDFFEGMENIKLIKIDTEGYDFQVLKGSIKTIKRCRPILIIEYKHIVDISKDIEQFLIGYYKIEIINSTNLKCVPL